MSPEALREQLQKLFSRLGQLEVARLELQAALEQQLADIEHTRRTILDDIAVKRAMLQEHTPTVPMPVSPEHKP